MQTSFITGRSSAVILAYLPIIYFCDPPRDCTRGHCHKIFPSVINTDVTKCSFSQRCISVWNSLPAETVCVRNVTEFKHMLGTQVNDALYSYVG